MDNIVIDGKEYGLTPLRCGELREIAKILKTATDNPKAMADASALDLWMPFLAKSIKRQHNDFKQELLDELTLPEFLAAWNKVCELSGIAFKPAGETKPTVPTGLTSTAESAAASAGPTAI